MFLPDRLERLQRIVSKLQMESGLCEEQLNQADTLLQTVSSWGHLTRTTKSGANISRAFNQIISDGKTFFDFGMEWMKPSRVC